MTVSTSPVSSSLINGIPGDCVGLSDRGLQYGDGLFETIRVSNGEPEYWTAHLRRLEHGCLRLKLQFPGVAALQLDVERLLQTVTDGIVKIILTRGPGQRGYRYGSGAGTRIVSVHPREKRQLKHPGSVRIRLCEQRLGINPALAGLKHLNRLEQVLARAEWNDDYHEGIMLDTEGRAIEGTMSNLFLVRDSGLLTPGLTGCGVAGIMREQILKEAVKLNIASTVRDIQPEELEQADELFVCNSVIGIWPVSSLQNKRWETGVVTSSLMRALGLPC